MGLRGGMDSSQYKDYVLFMLFIKYISDKYAGKPFSEITVPKGASFADMVALKGTPNIGDDINKKVVAPLAEANKLAQTALPDFDDSEKLGSGKEKVDRLTDLIAVFEKKTLNFSSNRADGDDIIGDAYEYLMRHFASESGKSKGQFYTPSEVSRVIAEVVGVNKSKTTRETTVYDPTCGSGSLLLKVASVAKNSVTIYGQEKDNPTSALARMNMILHNNPSAEIKQGNTLSKPLFLKENGELEQYDFVVANPPFSDKAWTTGVDVERDEFKRFDSFGTPPNKNGDYAYLLHIIRSLKSRGKGVCVLPHGVLFRGNAEADIRESLIRKGYIKGIIGLPANLFYGTGIPACLLVLDKEGASERNGIFIIDAGKGYIKDGNKNRLREMDIHKIVDVFNKMIEVEKYSRFVPVTEIENNEYNLNIPRYIDSSEEEDIQDIEAHLLGDIPKADVDALHEYWDVFPTLKDELFSVAKRSDNYLTLQVYKDDIKKIIFEHHEFSQFTTRMNKVFAAWRDKTTNLLKDLDTGFHPKELIVELGESLLGAYTDKPLFNRYDIYQHLMDYWNEVMQDDCYVIAADGWRADTYRITEKNRKNIEVDKGWTCDLIPKELVVNRYFSEEQKKISELTNEIEAIQSEMSEIEEEHSGDDGVLSSISTKNAINAVLPEYYELVWKSQYFDSYKHGQKYLKNYEAKLQELLDMTSHHTLDCLKNNKGKITIKAVKAKLKNNEDSTECDLLSKYLIFEKEVKKLGNKYKSLKLDAEHLIYGKVVNKEKDDYIDDMIVLYKYREKIDLIAEKKKEIKIVEADLDNTLLEFYPTLTEAQIKQLVVEDKWMSKLDEDIHGEMERISMRLTSRVKELADRYETPLPKQEETVKDLECKVAKHLEKMGYKW